MSLFPERSRPPVVERPQDFGEIPPEIERAGVTKIPVQFKAQVKSDTGQPLIQTPQSRVITIQLPADQAQLGALAKGSQDDSATWWGAYWIRIIKKAILFGWRLITGKAVT